MKVLPLAQQLEALKLGQLPVAAADTKVLANASKHSGIGWQRAGEMMIKRLEWEVRQLLVKTERTDATPLPNGLVISVVLFPHLNAP